MKIQEILGSPKMQMIVPGIPKILSKYNTFGEDLFSLFNYYILKKRGNIKIKLPGLGIIPSTICNARCNFCAYRFFGGKKEIMPFDIFKKSVDDYIEMGGKYVSLTPTLGEALIDPGFFDKVKYLRERNIPCALFTNATLLNSNNNIKKLINSGIEQIHFDFADILPEYSAKVFGISNEMAKKQLSGIIEFLQEKENQKSKINVNLDFRTMRPVKKIVRDMKKTPFWGIYKQGGFTMSFLQTYDNWGGQIKKSDMIGRQELKRPPKIKLYPCQALLMPSILPDGDVRLCGCRALKTLDDELVIGNIKNKSLEEFTKSKEWKKLIDDFWKGKRPKVCDNCSFYRPLIPKN